MEVGKEIVMFDNRKCKVVCTTEQGCVLEPVNNETPLVRIIERQKTKPCFLRFKLGQFIDIYI